MSKANKIPLIPGFVVPSAHRRNFRLNQNWKYENGLILPNDKSCATSKSTLYPPNKESEVPDWLNYDRKILRFDGFFIEELTAGKTTHRVRRVKLLFFLEDGTIQITEAHLSIPAELSEGCIVKRQKISRTTNAKDDFISILDLNVQRVVRIFDRNYTIADCDEFTRDFLTKAGIVVPTSIAIPEDPAEALKRQFDEAMQMQKSIPFKENELKKFLDFDKNVLRFKAYSIDKNANVFNQNVHELTLLYYLADDTIQINQIVEPNAGNSFPVFLRRQKIRKTMPSTSFPGQNNKVIILNVLGDGFLKGRFIADRAAANSDGSEFIRMTDLKIGTELNVFGHHVILYDCDQFTREYYRNAFGIEEMAAIERPLTSGELLLLRQQKSTERTLPPYNGFGSYEDTELSCQSIAPKAPVSDTTKLLKFDKIMLRFSARMISNFSANEMRSFVITYFMSDDTISVYETDERNSGFKNGTFLKRNKFYLPDQNRFGNERPLQVSPHHFYIGATVHLNGFRFEITGADEFTLNYMESNAFDFPRANIELILEKIRIAVKPIYKDFVGKYFRNVSTMSDNAFVCFTTMRRALIDLLGSDITEHEIITFNRYFDIARYMQSKAKCPRSVIKSLIQMDLARSLWDDLPRLREHLYQLYRVKDDDFIGGDKLYTTIVACKLPTSKDLIYQMFNVLEKNEQQEISVRDFLKFIDRFTCKADPIQPVDVYSFCRQNADETKNAQLINWNAFVQRLGLETKLKNETE